QPHHTITQRGQQGRSRAIFMACPAVSLAHDRGNHQGAITKISFLGQRCREESRGSVAAPGKSSVR
ncbi:hypothetical protein SPRG_19534, partial [Saprolegnia parasitica CBS 223.65]